MSATKRGGKRPKNNFYETPAVAVENLLTRYPFPEQGTILDAGCGRGRIGHQLLQRYPSLKLIGVEINPKMEPSRYARVIHADFLTEWTYEDPIDITIMNPPFPSALRFIRRALRISKVVIALLRLPFLETPKRGHWFNSHMPEFVFVAMQRYKFIKSRSSTDATPYCWIIWNQAWQEDYYKGQWIPRIGKDSGLDAFFPEEEEK